MRPKAFFYHYNKPRSRQLKKVQVSLHFNNQCHIVDNVVCDVKTAGRIRKTQPFWVIAGKAKSVVVKKNVAYIS